MMRAPLDYHFTDSSDSFRYPRGTVYVLVNTIDVPADVFYFHLTERKPLVQWFQFVGSQQANLSKHTIWGGVR